MNHTTNQVTHEVDPGAIRKAFERAAKSIQRGDYSASLTKFEVKDRPERVSIKAVIPVTHKTPAWPYTGPTHISPTMVFNLSVFKGQGRWVLLAIRIPPLEKRGKVVFDQEMSDYLPNLERNVADIIKKHGLQYSLY